MAEKTQTKAVLLLLEKGYAIAEENSLFGIRKKIPKNHELDFNENEDNFGHYIRYSVNSSIYENWIEHAVETFRGLGLQESKLIVKINDFDPSVESNLPAQKFIRALEEIEKIAENPDYINSYLKLNSLPPVKFHGGTLSQGVYSHRFQGLYADAISFLWDGREIQNQEHKVVRAANPKKQSMLEQKAGIKQSQLDNFAKALRQIQRKKNIHIQLKYPRNSSSVFLVVHEN